MPQAPQEGSTVTTLLAPKTPEVKALAAVLRDKLVADARQAMKAARELERQYELPPAKGMGR